MFIVFISILILILFQIIFLWIILISSKNLKSDEEKFQEDNIQMQYLKKYRTKHCIK